MPSRGCRVRAVTVDVSISDAADVPGRHDLRDDQGYIRSGYDVADDALVLVRPDNHVGLVTSADDAQAVRGYLAGLRH